MTAHRVLFCLFVASTGLVHAQGAASDEARRLEDAALERARRMKAAKEQAMYEPAPRDLNSSRGSAPAVKVSSQAMQQAAEPFYFQVVTSQGLVPLEQWESQQKQARAAASAPAPAPLPAPTAAPEVPKNHSVRLAFLSLGSGREKASAEGRAVPLESGNAKIGGASAAPAVPVADVAPAPQPSPAAEVVAVMEEVPATDVGGAPKRQLLGFLSGKGLEAALGGASVGESASDPKEPNDVGGRSAARQKSAPPQTKPEATPAPVTPLNEEPPKESLAGANREEFLNGLGQWLASTRKETFKPAWVAPKYAETETPAKADPGEATRSSGIEPANPDFYAIKAGRAPFHVIDTGAKQTHLMELDTGTVGRRHGEGDEWAWMQLDSGLMGLMKKRYLRPAVESEVVAFLATESEGGGVPYRTERPVRYVDVDLPDLPAAEEASGESLGGALFPAMPAMTSAPEPSEPLSASMPKPAASVEEPPPVVQAPPPKPAPPIAIAQPEAIAPPMAIEPPPKPAPPIAIAPPMAPAPPEATVSPSMSVPPMVLPRAPLEATRGGGVIAVPSPVPILP